MVDPTTHIISAPISIADLQQMVPVILTRVVNGQTQRRISGDIGVIIAANEGDVIPGSDGMGSWTVAARVDINMWARYKPQRQVPASEGPFPMSYHNRSGARNDGSIFGLKIPYCTLDMLNGLVSDLVYDTGTSDGWLYLKPRGDRTPQGGVQEFCRITDFVYDPNDITDDHTHGNGYNHYAPVPFTAVISSEGITPRYDGDGKLYYELNRQISNVFSMRFINSAGNDLHLQDLIDFNRNSGSIAWRPVIQVFDDSGWWYEHTTAYAQTAGDIIQQSAASESSISLSLSSFTENQYYHVCIGIGCCDADAHTFYDNNNSLFILPYTNEQQQSLNFPFYYRIRVVERQSRHIVATQMQFFQSGTTWVVIYPSSHQFTINSNAGRTMRLTFTITQEHSQSLEFIGQYGTVQDPSTNSPLKVRLREMISYQETNKYLTPKTSGWQNPSSNPVVPKLPEGQQSGTTTLYAEFEMGIISVGEYAEYHIEAFTGSTQGGEERYDDIGYFSIYKEQYH